MNFSRVSSIFVLVSGRKYSLILLYLLVIGSTALESIGIASFYPLTEVFQDSHQLEYYRDKLALLVPALEFLNREQFLLYSLLGIGALFIFKNLFLVLAGYGNIKVVTHLYYSWMNQIFKIYLDKPYSYYMDNKAGDLVQRKIMQTQKGSGALRCVLRRPRRAEPRQCGQGGGNAVRDQVSHGEYEAEAERLLPHCGVLHP